MYPLMNGKIDYAHPPALEGVEYHTIHDMVAECGRPNFLHGVSVERWGGRLVASFAFNEGPENTASETLLVKWSDDGGRTWGDAQNVCGAGKPYANSHSVFLAREDGLYLFGPRFGGLGEPPVTKKGYKTIRFLGLQMEGWRLEGERWRSLGVVGGDCWPLGAPERMDDGSYLIAGCDENWQAAMAISHGDDLTRWDVVKPDVDGEVFTEAGAWVSGPRVALVMRNQSYAVGGHFPAVVALSGDYGRHFSPCEVSNLRMTTTKPFCGRLSDGRPYLVFNQAEEGPHDRRRMLLGVGAQGALSIDCVYLLDTWTPPAPGQHGGLSYPYAREIDDMLYVAYSSTSAGGARGNENDAKLAIVPLSALA